jgi:hypothetical protein
MAPCWLITIHHNLQTFMRHVIDLIFLQFKNIIHDKQPTQIEINNVLSCCYISKVDKLSHVTMIL